MNLTTQLSDVAESLYPINLPDLAEVADSDQDNAINVMSGLTFSDWWVRATDDDGTVLVKAMHGNGVIIAEATFRHVPAGVIAAAFESLCWFASEAVAA